MCERTRCYHNGNAALIRGEHGVAVGKIHVAVRARPRSEIGGENFKLTNRNVVALKRQHGFFPQQHRVLLRGVAIMVTIRSFAHSYQSTWNGCIHFVLFLEGGEVK